MEVIQVILHTEMHLYDEKDIIFGKDDLGLFANLELADKFIEAEAEKELAKATMNADGAWIGAYPKEDDVSENHVCERMQIMIEKRKEGDTYIYTYLVQKRTIQEA